MVIPGRSSSTTAYKWGYNGQEKDDEVYGSGNSLAWTERMYNPRVIRFGSSDKLQTKYPDLSPYSFVNNSPIKNKEIDGNYWLETNVCYVGTCKYNGEGHGGYHRVTSARIYITNASSLRAINVATNVPFSPEVSWTALFTKMGLALKDNSINFDLIDWVGIALNVVGAGIAKEAKGLKEAALIDKVLDLNRSVPGMTYELFQNFKQTDYYNLVLDKGAVKKLENEGMGSLSEDGVFSFNQKTLNTWHDEFAKAIDQNPEKYGVTN